MEQAYGIVSILVKVGGGSVYGTLWVGGVEARARYAGQPDLQGGQATDHHCPLSASLGSYGR